MSTKNSEIETICVFCSSSEHGDPAFFEAAKNLGAEIGHRNKRLVWGGTNTGLMRELGRSAQANGGRVTAVLPQSMADLGLSFQEADELIVTKDMRERKATMDARADAFVAMPGGIGTLEELMEILTLKQLRVHAKPVILFNVNGFYDPLLDMLNSMIQQRLARPSLRLLWQAVSSVGELFRYIDEYHPPEIELKWS